MAINSGDSHLKVGVFAIGLDTYWPQFEGLEQRLTEAAGTVAQRLGRPGVEVVNLGMIDTPEKAARAGREFRSACVDLLFLHVTTYALSSTVLPVVRRAGVPVIVLNLSPGAAIDYAAFNAMADRGRMTGEWLAWCHLVRSWCERVPPPDSVLPAHVCARWCSRGLG